jgi:ferredoxin
MGSAFSDDQQQFTPGETRDGAGATALRVDRALDAELPPHSTNHVIALHHQGAGDDGRKTTSGFTAAASALADAGARQSFDEVVAGQVRRLREARRPALRRVSEEVELQRTRLRELLEADAELDPGGHSEDALARSAGGPALAQLDLAALARNLPDARGPKRLSERRRSHVVELVRRLEAALPRLQAPEVHLYPVRGLSVEMSADASPAVLEDAVDGPHAAASARARSAVSDALDLARALRAARLELAHAYDPTLHGPVLAGLAWEDLGRDEQLACPALVALDRLSQAGAHLTEWLCTPLPVHALIAIEPGPDLDAALQPPLAALALAAGQGAWLQASVARPEHMDRGLSQLAEATGPSVASVLAGDDAAAVDLAVASGAFPLVLVDPRAKSLEDRIQLADALEADTPLAGRELSCVDGSGRAQSLELEVTWADVAALHPNLRDRLSPIESSEWASDQWPMGRFLDAWERGELEGQVPFVWVVDADGALRRAIVDRELSRRARDVRRAHEALGRLFGPRNPWAEQAARDARAQAEAEAEQARRELSEAHEGALGAARREAGSEALRRLAEALLSLDPLAPTSAAAEPSSRPSQETADAQEAAPPAEPAPAPAPEPPEAPREPPPAVDELEPPSEPYVESERCTTCNECTEKFPQLFAYDENKQAELIATEPPFEQLVLAAEQCPARCIHTGVPREGDETVTEALVKRAQPFL